MKFKLSILAFFVSSCLDSSLNVQSYYSSTLNNSSETYCHRESCSGSLYYYEGTSLNVSVSGYYIITSNSSMDTYGYIYNNSFNSSMISQNLISSDNDSGDFDQFMFYMFLKGTTKYILVTTTDSPYITGRFTIMINGPGSISFNNG